MKGGTPLPDDDWALSQGTVDFRNEERRHRHGYACPNPEADWIAMLADDPDLHLITSDAAAYDRAHPCECEGVCECP